MRKHIKRTTAVYIAAIILLVAIVSGSVIAVAEYTKSNRAKRVVSSYESEGVLFSSNYLVINPSLDTTQTTTPAGTRRIIYTGNASNTVTAAVTICNYAQSDPAKPYDANIRYNMTATLVRTTGDTKRPATAEQVGSLTATVSFGGHDYVLDGTHLTYDMGTGTLTGNVPSTDVCTITFARSWNDASNGVYVYLLAEPVQAYAGTAPLEAIFRTAVSDNTVRNDWRGMFTEAGAMGDTGAAGPAAYDGFRYTVEGSGAGTCRLQWDGSVLTVNALFVSLNGLQHGNTAASIQNGTGDLKYIDFDVDSNEKSRYDTQFYYSGLIPDDIDDWDWDDIKSLVTLIFTADTD